MGSPRIVGHGWGWLEVEGGARYKDASLSPEGAQAWDWGLTGTRHEPGIGLLEVKQLVEQGARVMVLSRGVHERLAVQPETLRWLQAQGIEVHVLQTDAAIARYNELADQGPVGALIHTTC
jgi:hypothetical protein